jgi:hypothetical protein
MAGRTRTGEMKNVVRGTWYVVREETVLGSKTPGSDIRRSSVAGSTYHVPRTTYHVFRYAT